MATNYASKYSNSVDERFAKESQSKLGCSGKVDFTGVKSVKVYSFPTVELQDYNRTAASNRYGVPANLEDAVQEMTVTKDRAFTYTIDRMDRDETQMTHDAGKSLSRQISEVVKPEIDKFTFGVMATAAEAAGGVKTASITKSNAYELFLGGTEYLGDNLVPDKGRVAFCSYKFANLLKQDSAFVRYGDASQAMLQRGEIGEVDAIKIVMVPASRLPENTHCILVHPSACVQAMRLQDYKTHDNPPGVNGWLIEGRIVYDAFVFDSKKNGIYVIKSSAT